MSKNGINNASESIATIKSSQYVIGNFLIPEKFKCPPYYGTYLSLIDISDLSKKLTDWVFPSFFFSVFGIGAFFESIAD